MTLDSAAKRLMVMDFGDVFQPGMPIPDGAIMISDRSHLLWGYYIVYVPVVISPGCATVVVSLAHTATAVVEAIHTGEAVVEAIHMGEGEVLTCDLTMPTAEDGVLEAWIGPGVLEALFEAATGETADSTFGCYAMAEMGGRLFFGLGNAPGGTNGALVVSTTDGQAFTIEKVLDEQGVLDMSVHGGVLWVPGADPTDDWTLGNVYKRVGGVWTKLRTLPNTIHTFGLWHDGTHLHVGVGAHAGDMTTWLGQTLRSLDDGATWEAAVTISDYRVYDIIGWQGRLYAVTYSAVAVPRLHFSEDDGATWTEISGLFPAQNPRLTIWGSYLVGATRTGGLFVIDTAHALTQYTTSFVVNTSKFNVLAGDASYFYALEAGESVYRTVDFVNWSLYTSVENPIGIGMALGYLWILTSEPDAQICRTEV